LGSSTSSPPTSSASELTWSPSLLRPQWSFAQSHHVLLPDEYDPIHASLLPFYALPPDDFLARTAEAERVPETYTLIVKAGGKVVLQWNDDYARNEYWAARPRADAQINLLEPFLERLGEMRITFSIHDEPSVVLPYERRAELEGIAKGPVGARECRLCPLSCRGRKKKGKARDRFRAHLSASLPARYLKSQGAR
jgi:hypothetical protein